MFNNEKDPLALLIELTPKRAKRRFREAIYEDWDHCCAYCGRTATSLDHVIPRFKSGSSNRNNLVPSCQRCNSNKGSLDMQTWYESQDFYCPKRYAKIVSWTEQEFIDFYDFVKPTISYRTA